MTLEEKIDAIQEDVSLLRVQVAKIETAQKYIMINFDSLRCGAHERKLESLDAGKNRIYGAAIVISGLVTLIVSLIAQYFKN